MSQSVADRLDADAGREWSDAELTELGEMLMRGLSIEEIARSLRRDHREVRDKVGEVGRAVDREGTLPRPSKAAGAWLQLPTRASPVGMIGPSAVRYGRGLRTLSASAALWQNAGHPKIGGAQAYGERRTSSAVAARECDLE